MRILLVAGMPGAGKEELLGVARSMEIPFLRMGDIVREHHAESGTGLSVGAYANAQREELGKDIWARRALERMHGDIFLVDGCRSMDEVRSYRGLSDDVLIVGIFAPPEARFERLVKRGRDDAPQFPCSHQRSGPAPAPALAPLQPPLRIALLWRTSHPSQKPKPRGYIKRIVPRNQRGANPTGKGR